MKIRGLISFYAMCICLGLSIGFSTGNVLNMGMVFLAISLFFAVLFIAALVIDISKEDK